MNNITQQWRDGWLEDRPMARYEKLKSCRHKINDDKERTVQLKKSRHGGTVPPGLIDKSDQ
jgi:hypothetical protein